MNLQAHFEGAEVLSLTPCESLGQTLAGLGRFANRFGQLLGLGWGLSKASSLRPVLPWLVGVFGSTNR